MKKLSNACKKSSQRPRRKWEDNKKMHLKRDWLWGKQVDGTASGLSSMVSNGNNGVAFVGSVTLLCNRE